MAFKEKEIKKLCVLLFLATVFSQVTFINAIHYDCKGKAFYCLNSTHFMICLDLGDGISTTVEDFIIPCPPPTICIESNGFECEYHTTTTLKPIVQSEEPVTELNVQTWRDNGDYTTFLPFWYNREVSVKSEKYYDILDDQPNLLASEQTETSIQQESTTEAVIGEMTIKTTTLEDEKSTLFPTVYSMYEDITTSTNVAYDDGIEASSQHLEVDLRNEVSEGYDHYFDSVSTNTLSESTTQMTTQYNEIQSSTNYDYDPIFSKNTIITEEEPFTPRIQNLYTYQEDTTHAPLKLEMWHGEQITLTPNFASDQLITTPQETENDEIKGTTNSEISNSIPVETEKYLNTFTDQITTDSDKVSSITTFQEAEENNKATNTERNNIINTEMNNYLHNNAFDTTTPLITFQQKSGVIDHVLINNTGDALMSKTENYINYNSITTLPLENTATNYGETGDTDITYNNANEANINYPTITEIHEYINNVLVSTTEENTINEEYEANFQKSTTTIDKSAVIDIKYVTRPYASQIFNNDVSTITEQSTYYPRSYISSANVDTIIKNIQDIITNNEEINIDFMPKEMTSQTDENLLDLQTTLKIPITDYIIQDDISPYDNKTTIYEVDEQSQFSTENTVLDDFVSSTTKDNLRETHVESTIQLGYQTTTDSLLLSSIEAPLLNTIKDKLIVPRFSAIDNVTEINNIDTVIIARNNDYYTKQSNNKNQDKGNTNFYTTNTQTYDSTSFSPPYVSVMRNSTTDFKNPKTTATESKNDLKTMVPYIKETTTSEQENKGVYTYGIEDHTSTMVLMTLPLLDNADLYTTEKNNNQYEVTKEMNVKYHHKTSDIASTTPSLYNLNNLEGKIRDDKKNLEKTVKEPLTKFHSTPSMSNDESNINNVITFNTNVFTPSYANNNVINRSTTVGNDVTGNLQDNVITESPFNIQSISPTKIIKNQESKPINTTKYDDTYPSMVENTYPMVDKSSGPIPDKNETIKVSTSAPPVPVIAIINGTKTVVIYSKDSKIEGEGDVNKLPAIKINNNNSTRNITVVVSDSARILKDSSQLNFKIPIISNASYAHIHKAEVIKSPISVADNITVDKHETTRQMENITQNFQNTSKQKKESVPVQFSEPCNKTLSNATTYQSNKTSSHITSEQLNFTCINRYRGKYSDQNNCLTFYMCIGTMSPIVGQCPQNSVFSDILNQCTRNLSHCVRNNQFQCVAPGRFSDLWSKDTYYICVRQKNKFVRFMLRCQKGYFLNRTSITCVKDPVIKNYSSTSESYSTSSSSSSSSSTDSKSERSVVKSDIEFKCEKEGIFSDPNHCRRYYICKKVSKSEIRLKKKKCDSDEVFNKKKKKCVDEDSYECKT